MHRIIFKTDLENWERSSLKTLNIVNTPIMENLTIHLYLNELGNSDYAVSYKNIKILKILPLAEESMVEVYDGMLIDGNSSLELLKSRILKAVTLLGLKETFIRELNLIK